MNFINWLYWETEIENWLRNLVKQIPCGLKTPWSWLNVLIKFRPQGKIKGGKKKLLVGKSKLIANGITYTLGYFNIITTN